MSRAGLSSADRGEDAACSNLSPTGPGPLETILGGPHLPAEMERRIGGAE